MRCSVWRSKRCLAAKLAVLGKCWVGRGRRCTVRIRSLTRSTLDGIRTRLKGGEYVDVQCGPIKNPVNGAEVHPSVVLPEGIILKRGDLGATTYFRVNHQIGYDHSGQYMAVGPFEYSRK